MKISKRNCNYCGKYYEGYGKQFCSIECSDLSKVGISKINSGTFKKGIIPWNKNVVRKNCKFCGNEFIASPSIAKTKKYCNASCYSKDIKPGKYSNAWKGGLTSINKLLRTSKEFKEWRKFVFERDNYTCKDCGYNYKYDKLVKRKLHPHHIFWVSRLIKNEFKKHIFNIDNGITLCEKCHGKIHPNLL